MPLQNCAREFCRRQALLLIEHAEHSCDDEAATVLLDAAGYWLEQLERIERAERSSLLSRQCGQSSP